MDIHKTDRTPRMPVRISYVRHSPKHYTMVRGDHACAFHRVPNGWDFRLHGTTYSRPTLRQAVLVAFRAQGAWAWGYDEEDTTIAQVAVKRIGHDYVAIDYGHGIMLCRSLPSPKTDAESTQLAQLRAIAQEAFYGDRP